MKDSGGGTDKLRVLFVTHNYIRRPGDFAGVFLHLLARKLREENMEIHVLAPHDAGCAEFEEIDHIKIHRFRYASDERETLAYRGNMHRQIFENPFRIFTLMKFIREATAKASRIIKSENIDLVSIHWLVPGGLIGRRLRGKFGSKPRFVLSSHGTDIRLLTAYRFLLPMFRSLISESTAWTVVSSYLKELIARRDPSLAEKMTVIPLPNDERMFYPEESIMEDPNLIVAVARLTIQKRLDYLIKAFVKAREERPHLRLEIYGSGPEKNRLMSLIEENKITDRVRIFEPIAQKDLRRVYARAAVVVLNSVDEGFGLVLTEAMLCRKPVIGARSGGIVDIIDHGVNGFLVPPDDVDALAEFILKVVSQPGLRDRFARAGYEKAITQFSSSATAKKYAEIFRS